MNDYIEVGIEIFNERQRAKVRTTLTMGTLIQEILKEFSKDKDLDREPESRYAVYREGEQYPVSREKSIQSLNIQPQEILTFGWFKPIERQPLQGARKALLRNELNKDQIFRILWQPAIIGRTDSVTEINRLLVVNVENLPGGKRASRQHAQITQSDGQFVIESLDGANHTYVNDEQVRPKEKFALKLGDKISLGRTNLVFTFILE